MIDICEEEDNLFKYLELASSDEDIFTRQVPIVVGERVMFKLIEGFELEKSETQIPNRNKF